MKSLAAAVLMIVLVGCTGHHGQWSDGKSFLFSTDDSYILETGEICGGVTKSDYDLNYKAWVHGYGRGEWSTLEQAKRAVASDWRCR